MFRQPLFALGIATLVAVSSGCSSRAETAAKMAAAAINAKAPISVGDLEGWKIDKASVGPGATLNMYLTADQPDADGQLPSDVTHADLGVMVACGNATYAELMKKGVVMHAIVRATDGTVLAEDTASSQSECDTQLAAAAGPGPAEDPLSAAKEVVAGMQSKVPYPMGHGMTAYMVTLGPGAQVNLFAKVDTSKMPDGGRRLFGGEGAELVKGVACRSYTGKLSKMGVKLRVVLESSSDASQWIDTTASTDSCTDAP
jgi:hypothetical protein